MTFIIKFSYRGGVSATMTIREAKSFSEALARFKSNMLELQIIKYKIEEVKALWKILSIEEVYRWALKKLLKNY